jgi:hypothetical protein
MSLAGRFCLVGIVRQTIDRVLKVLGGFALVENGHSNCTALDTRLPHRGNPVCCGVGIQRARICWQSIRLWYYSGGAIAYYG